MPRYVKHGASAAYSVTGDPTPNRFGWLRAGMYHGVTGTPKIVSAAQGDPAYYSVGPAPVAKIGNVLIIGVGVVQISSGKSRTDGNDIIGEADTFIGNTIKNGLANVLIEGEGAIEFGGGTSVRAVVIEIEGVGTLLASGAKTASSSVEIEGVGETEADGDAAGLTSITKVLDSVSTGATLTLPVGIEEGDLICIYDTGFNVTTPPSAVVPGDFTNVNGDQTRTDGGIGGRILLNYKLADGDEGGETYTGMDATTDRKACVVFRGNVPITSVTAASPLISGASGNPGSIEITSGSGAAPLVVFAGWAVSNSANTVDPRTMSPAKDAEVEISSNAWAGWKIYDTSPANVTVDMDDEGSLNLFGGCYFACS